ncbi:TM2 domain-containing protein [Sphingomonas oligophenolica]|uniref:TM2 domain-containing protein n=1 Tax=Sphingomonas oligophenolica TaxID=301154 RepID=A0A502CT76_9SPHN|nr:TM2 domain-containing protein [Sphingomonas oligophenolica]TPG15299.1 TM2 domain-containing protein [Sphingomonas oligophenolica]
MRGHILGVDARTGDGMVAGEDGERYAFRPADWAARGEPAVGLYVDFDAADNRALSLFPAPGANPIPSAADDTATRVPDRRAGNDRNKYVAAVLAFLLGVLGVHRFYTGRTGSAVVMLVLTFTVVGTVLTVPWSLIDMVRYLMMSDREFAVRYPRLA